MAKFTTLESHVVPLPAENVDTDQIIPARFLKVTDKDGLGKSLFCDWRYLADGSDNPAFVLNEPASQGAAVLLAGDNFGCGSSREHAPWALVGWGLRALISTSFADIFKSNSLKNGLLPIEVSKEVHQQLMAAVNADRTARVQSTSSRRRSRSRAARRSRSRWTRSPSAACSTASTSWATS
jgi:3-isopropylmalate/(R)-2-methylmalate dehydratase small subunit